MMQTSLTLDNVVIRRPNERELWEVGVALNELHTIENGNDLEITATPLRAAKFIKGMIMNGTGEMFCAFYNGNFLGCIALQFNIIKNSHSMLVSGLYVRPNSPKKTVLMLLRQVVIEANKRRIVNIWMLARNEKNQNRQTYKKLGFTVSGVSAENLHLMTTTTGQFQSHIEKLLKDRIV